MLQIMTIVKTVKILTVYENFLTSSLLGKSVIKREGCISNSYIMNIGF